MRTRQLDKFPLIFKSSDTVSFSLRSCNWLSKIADFRLGYSGSIHRVPRSLIYWSIYWGSQPWSLKWYTIFGKSPQEFFDLVLKITYKLNSFSWRLLVVSLNCIFVRFHCFILFFLIRRTIFTINLFILYILISLYLTIKYFIIHLVEPDDGQWIESPYLHYYNLLLNNHLKIANQVQINVSV